MAYEKDQKILAEVSEAVDGIKRDAGLSSNTSIRADLLNEDPKSFSTDSMSYVGIAAGIMEENEELFALSRLCDRFAPQYLKICKTLEKTVEYLGSVCVTKSAMKYYQQDVSVIDQLTIHRLHQMISFNFRKVKAALDQKKEKLHEFDLDLYDQMMSFAKVMERLCATEYRATAIDLGLEEPKKLVKKTVTFSEKKSDSVSPLRELPSYPIDYDVLEKSGARNKEQGASLDSEKRIQDSGIRDQQNPELETHRSDDNAIKQQMCDNNGCEFAESDQPAASETLSPEKQEKFNTLSNEEKKLYTEAIQNSDILEEMRSKVENKGYCYLHQAEIHSLNKVLSVIDST